MLAKIRKIVLIAIIVLLAAAYITWDPERDELPPFLQEIAEKAPALKSEIERLFEDMKRSIPSVEFNRLMRPDVSIDEEQPTDEQLVEEQPSAATIVSGSEPTLIRPEAVGAILEKLDQLEDDELAARMREIIQKYKERKQAASSGDVNQESNP